MGKMRFIIVGSGWRSLYYVRIAKALQEEFELCAMLCRTKEKAKRLAEENDIYTTTSIEECQGMKPDFVVVAVDKESIAKVSMEWMDYGFTVLCETPASLEQKELETLWRLHEQGKKLVVAEQYIYYPRYHAMLEVLKKNIIGEPYNINISLAHDYHGANLMRAFLKEDLRTPFTVRAKTYAFPTALTLDRYERFTDGRVKDKNRTVATFEFSSGKVAWYDFNPEQYRSPIRRNYVKVEGERGQLRDDRIDFLGEDFLDRIGELKVTENQVITGSKNPNLYQVREVEQIIFQTYKKNISGEMEDLAESKVYEAYFGKCNLAEDETAIARLMQETWEYAVCPSQEVLDRQSLMLKNALQDAYMAILMQQAISTGEQISSEEQIWF